MHTLLCITLSAIVAFAASTPTYTAEPSVKLLSVGYFAERFPAPDSEYRVLLDGGEDVPADLGPLDEANNMPDKFLILMPGGHAVYQIPINRDKMFLMIQPGKKDGKYKPDFKEKADITVTAAVDDNSEKIVCHVPSNDGSPQASDYCLLNITALVTDDTVMEVTVEVPANETRNASLWELWVSPEDDSRRARGTFDDSGRQRLGQTQETAEFNTSLTLISVVGKTGVGKSTVASFLAGNMSMFTSASSADGTTTVGTDMSPIIPSQDYITVMSDKLQEGDISFSPDLYEPIAARPVFFLDSEGMSFRGDEFDFITSGPAAIIAKVIVWITTDRIRPPDVLEDIREYLDGLDRISMGEDSGASTAGYGQFVVVLNKMQDEDKPDDELLGDLMGYPGKPEEMETIAMLEERFEDVSVVGLSLVHVGEGEEFGFPVLPERFRQGLNKIANKVLRGTETARYVDVGNEKYEMNSTESVLIVSMLIDAANQGNIDLTDPCNVIYTIKKEKVIKEINLANEDLETKLPSSCENTEHGVKCRTCICPYRNSLIDTTVDKLKQVIDDAVEDAQAICKDPSVADRIENLKELVTAWENQVGRCNENFIGNDDSDICDISEMSFKTNETRNCISLFLCGEQTLPDSEISIVVQESIYIDSLTKLEIGAPPKPEKASDGQNGSPGMAGKDLKINITGCSLLPGSQHQLLVILTGGDGGDGGDGSIVKATATPPGTCDSVYEEGSRTGSSTTTCTDLDGDRHCPYVPYQWDCECAWGADCYGGSEEDRKYHKYETVSNCPSTIPDGGNGGDGGEAGECQIFGSDIDCNSYQSQGKGGFGGKAGYGEQIVYDLLATAHFAYGYWYCCPGANALVCDYCCRQKWQKVSCKSLQSNVSSRSRSCEGKDGSDGKSETK